MTNYLDIAKAALEEHPISATECKPTLPTESGSSVVESLRETFKDEGIQFVGVTKPGEPTALDRQQYGGNHNALRPDLKQLWIDTFCSAARHGLDQDPARRIAWAAVRDVIESS